MKKLIYILLCIVFLPCAAYDRMDFYNYLLIDGKIFIIKEIIDRNRPNLSEKDYDSLIFHLQVTQGIIHCTMETNFKQESIEFELLKNKFSELP